MTDRDTRAAAHDFNNLLTAIIGAADAVLERADIDPETRADVAHIREGASRGAALIRRLRDDVADVPEIVSVNQTIRATHRLLGHRLGSRIGLVLDLAEPGGHVLVDPAQLDRVLLNLVANAHHAMPDGGTVTMATARRLFVVAEAAVPDTIPPGDYEAIIVADTGMGIRYEQVARIFEAGFSTRHDAGGSGLGLASVREIVRQANGYLAVESVEGCGARFAVYLPRVAGPSPPLVSHTPRTTIAGSVLVVEDDPLVRPIIERALCRAGWTVRCAESAEDALQVLNESHHDLIISDIALPGMDGMALIRLVLARRPAPRVILTSGYAQPAMAGAFGAANVAFLTKPYGQRELLAAVARMVQPPDA